MEEYSAAYQRFHDNYIAIKVHNAQDYSYQLRVNKFADFTKEEFRHYYTSAHVDRTPWETGVGKAHEHPRDDLPDSVDWTEKNRVTGVKDQG